MSIVSSGITLNTAYNVTGDLTGNLIFQSNGTTEAVRIDTNQNVGIGTTNPGQKLEVNGWVRTGIGASATGGLELPYYSGSASSRTWRLRTDVSAYGDFSIAQATTQGGATFSDKLYIDSTGNVLVGTITPYSGTASNFTASTGVDIGLSSTATSKQLQFIRNATTGTAGNIYATAGSFTNYCGIEFVIDNVAGGSQAGSLRFNTATNATTSESVRITQEGILIAGEKHQTGASAFVNSNCKLQVYGGSNEYSTIIQNIGGSTPYGLAIKYSAVTPNNTGSQWINCEDSSAVRFKVVSNGGVYNYSGNNSNLSDRREKKNFAPAKSYLETICSIPVQTFNYIDQNMEEDGDSTLGVVAQDVQAVAPELVTETNWGTTEDPKMRLSIYQTDMQYALMKCIQELKAIVDAQAIEIAELKGKA